jgi:hypothetical protein
MASMAPQSAILLAPIFRYYRLASPLVAQMLEAVLVVAADRLRRLRSMRLPTVIAGSIVDGTDALVK